MPDGTSVGSLYYDVGIDDKGLQSQLDNADKNVKQLGDNAADSFDKFQKGAKVAAIGLGVVGAGLTLYAKNATDYTIDLVKSSKALGTQIGVSTSEASRLVAALGRMGIESSNAAQMFGIFSKQIVASTTNSTANTLATEKLQIQMKQTEAAIAAVTKEITTNGDKSGTLRLKLADLNNTLATQKDQLNQSADAFGKLGVSTKDAQGHQKDFNTILFDVADKFKAMPNGVDKTSIALQLFGRSGKDMVKVLNLGSQGIQDLEKQADKLGLTLNANTITSISKLISEQKDLKQETDAMKIAVGTATAPVLTEFTSKLNQLVLTLLNSHSPLHGLTVDVLAFGGPIAGAASGVLAFLANLDQAKGALLLLGQGMVGMIGLLQSPWVLAFIAAGAAVAIVTDHLLLQHGQADQLKTAQDNLTTATKNLKGAQDDLAGAQLNAQGAALAVEQAQLNYNNAVSQYGPHSLEARQAAYDLTVAQQNQRDAHDQVRAALDKLHAKEVEVAKDKELIKHLQDVSGAADGIKTSADGAVISINKLADKANTVNSVGQKINLAPLLKRASGGPVEMGRQYLTGEQGPELFVPSQSGTIIPADLTRKLMGSGSSSPSTTTHMGDTLINIGQINNAQDEEYVIRRFNRDHVLEGMGLGPTIT